MPICQSGQNFLSDARNDLQAPTPPPTFGPPKIDFFDVSDDLEQEKKFSEKKKILGLGCTEAAPQGLAVSSVEFAVCRGLASLQKP